MLLLDNVSPLERIRLSGQLSAQVQALQAADSVLARIGAARQVAELLRKLGAGDPANFGRAPAGGVVGLNGEFYKGGTFLPNTTLPKQGKAAGSARAATGVLIEPGVRADAPEAGAKSIFNSYREFIAVDAQGVASVIERPDAAIAAYVDEDVAEGRAFLRAAVAAYNAGMRWFKPGDIGVADEHREPPAAEQPQIIEHTTGRGKVIRGIVRTDLSYADAKAIDPYVFKKNGGWFIRLKHANLPTPS